MEWIAYAVVVILAVIACRLSYNLGTRDGAQKILDEWKNWLNNPEE